MNIAIDVHYQNDEAATTGIMFEDWASDEIHQTIVTTQGEIGPYETGAFYKRELPCILSLIEKLDEKLDCIVIDGYVTLGSNSTPGLGAHLYSTLDRTIPVIGVAKSAFKNTPIECELFRGHSKKPLFVTSAGLELSKAKKLISTMHGRHRYPTYLSV